MDLSEFYSKGKGQFDAKCKACIKLRKRNKYRGAKRERMIKIAIHPCPSITFLAGEVGKFLTNYLSKEE